MKELKALRRYGAIARRQIQALRVRWLIDEFKDGDLKGVYVSTLQRPHDFENVWGDPPDCRYTDPALADQISRPLAELRTDLDRFSQREADLLSYHGYWTVFGQLACHRPELLGGMEPSWQEFEDLELDRELAVELGTAAKRVLRPARRLTARLTNKLRKDQ